MSEIKERKKMNRELIRLRKAYAGGFIRG